MNRLISSLTFIASLVVGSAHAAPTPSSLPAPAPATQATQEGEIRNPILARVNGEPIHVEDMRNYAKITPTMTGYMTHLAGLQRVLNDMINVRLLTLEGQRQEIPRTSDATDSVYAFFVKSKLVQKCGRIDEAGSKVFYAAYPELFSTPAFARLNKVYLKLNDNIDGLPAAEFMQAQAQALRAKKVKFDSIVNKVRSKIPPEIVLGDIGFLPLNEKDSIIEQISQAKVGSAVGPIERDGNTYLFQVTDRREPILTPWNEVRDKIPDLAFQKCSQDRFAVLRKQMESHFPVVIYEDKLRSLRFN